MKIIALLLGVFLLVACASTNLSIVDKSDTSQGKNAIHYQCSPMKINVFHDNAITDADMFLEFKKIGEEYYWLLTIDCSRVAATWTELKSVKLELDNYNKPASREKVVVVDEDLIINDTTTHTNSFYVNDKFLKRVIHADEVLITAVCNGNEAVINLANAQIEQIGMFYQYIKRNILNNASVIII